MCQAGVAVSGKKRFRKTTDSRHGYPIAPNLLDRRFEVSQPNRFWASDITYLWTKEGWLYLAVVMDLYSRKVVGWTISKRMTSDPVKDALTMAFGRRRPDTGLIHHSDRGSQYASYDYQQLMAGYGMIGSVSGKGDC
ncbi:MAG: IS3 family transposase [Chloroflexota bacterium]|nr:IS3 family transposase [Chloroflexota bacterium]